MKNYFKTTSESLTSEEKYRSTFADGLLSFGCKAIDDLTGGIHRNDLVLLSARTGAGKTEMAINIAMTNALKGKRVHFFSLESEEDEIIRRIKYKFLVKKFYEQFARPQEVPNYLDWSMGKQNHLLLKFEVDVNEELSESLKTLFYRYRKSDFAIDDFSKEVFMIQNQTDLIIVDHLHYFDFDDHNENVAMKAAIKQIRDTAMLVGKPVVLIAHLRKSDKNSTAVIPSLDDIHGSSDIAKIATKAILFSSVRSDDPNKRTTDPFRYQTYFRVAKNRLDGSRCHYGAVIDFNVKLNQYDHEYLLGRFNFNDSEFTFLQPNERPPWIK